MDIQPEFFQSSERSHELEGPSGDQATPGKEERFLEEANRVLKGRVIQVNKTEREVLSKGNNVNTTSEARNTMACFNTPRTQMHEVRL